MLSTALLAIVGLANAARGVEAARPSECVAVDGSTTTNRWERAKQPQLKEYCDLIARGMAHLVNSPALLPEVLVIADKAEKLLPGRAAANVLRGRALLRLGKVEEALAAFREAQRRDDRALDDPAMLLAWARANARGGHFEESTRAYRAVLPRAGTMPASERVLASFEAGLNVMATGERGADDAIAMLRQARKEAQGTMQLATVVALALALDRSGQKDESRAMLVDRVRGDVRSALSDAKVTEALAEAGMAHEREALLGIALEPVDAAGAREAWKRYVEGPGGKGPWGDHARAHAAQPAKNRGAQP